jgi:membrane protease YdiL (CAAX protease family)
MTAALEDRTPFVLVVAAVALALRPIGWGAVAVTAAVGIVGALGAARSHPSRLAWPVVVAVGVAAFVVVRMQSGLPSMRTTAVGIGASLAAAVAEELFFRRFVYSWFERWGAIVAVASSAVLFGLVHVPGYGLRALPIDVAAGLVFGWQRWASGTWTAPAATHAAANLIQVLR